MLTLAILNAAAPSSVTWDDVLSPHVYVFYAAFIIILNLIADILYAVLDPRVRLNG